MFTDPVIKRLASIEDWLEVSLWVNQGRPEEAKPLGAFGFESNVLHNAEKAKKRAVEAVPVDVAAEMARRRRRAKKNTAQQPPGVARTNPAGLQSVRDELAERRRRLAAAQ